jgi:hypothetical protein
MKGLKSGNRVYKVSVVDISNSLPSDSPEFDDIVKDCYTEPVSCDDVEPQTYIGLAFDTLKQAVQEDPEYAWAFHCNLAVPFMDEGGSHKAANRAAARIMYNLFRVDTSQNQHFKDLGFNIKIVIPDDMNDVWV